MKTIPFSILIITLYAISFSQTAWEIYLLNPCPKNAININKIDYSSERSFQDQEMDILLLEIQVNAHDKEAIDLAFKLRTQTGDHFGELFDIMLGNLIRSNPYLFLKYFNKYRKSLKHIGNLVNNFGPAYVDRIEARKYEKLKRIESLKSIKDKNLIKDRDECINELNAS